MRYAMTVAMPVNTALSATVITASTTPVRRLAPGDALKNKRRSDADHRRERHRHGEPEIESGEQLAPAHGLREQQLDELASAVEIHRAEHEIGERHDEQHHVDEAEQCLGLGVAESKQGPGRDREEAARIRAASGFEPGRARRSARSCARWSSCGLAFSRTWAIARSRLS